MMKELLSVSLDDILRLAWVAATLPVLLASLPVPPFLSLHRFISRFAARGKTVPASSSKKFTVPQRYFLHFYIVALVLTTVLLLSTWFYAYRNMLPLASESLSHPTIASQLIGGSHIFSIHKGKLATVEHRYEVWQTVFLLLLMEVQVLRRLHETVNIFHYSPSARMHVLGYLAGLLFILIIFIKFPVALPKSSF